jgi:hypothetical protein
MEIITKVRDFPEKIKHYRIPPETRIRVIITDTKTSKVSGEGVPLPFITHEEQRRRLNLMPKQYEPGASEELTEIIRKSRMNTDSPEL